MRQQYAVLFAAGAGLFVCLSSMILQGNMVVTRNAAMCGLSSSLLFPSDGTAPGCEQRSMAVGQRTDVDMGILP